MAWSLGAMFGAGAAAALIERALPDPQIFATAPIVIAVFMAVLLFGVGTRLSRRLVALGGPIGVVTIAYAVATLRGPPSDLAGLFALPVLWQSLFFGRRGAVAVLALVGLADAFALVLLHRYGTTARWINVMVPTAVIAVVVALLQEQNRRLLEFLSHEARVDPLTGLLNRRGFEERARVQLAHLHRDPQPFSLVTFDVDHFKRINDEWGHEVGDRVLRHIARGLRAHAREVDLLARFGGEEFVALLPGADVDGARAFAERVRAGLAEGGDTDLPAVRLSAGVRCGAPGADLGVLVSQADMALYEAKRAGRDQIRVFADVA